MQIDLTALPEDSAALQSMIRDVVTATMQRDAQVAELSVENDKLRALIQKLLRHRFGRRSEQLSPDQLKLAIEDIEQEIAEREAAEDASAQSEEARRRRRDVRPRRNLGALPAHLPRDEVVIDIDSKECPCCGGALHLIDETRTEMLDIVPAQLRAKVIRRPRYGCRACGEAVVQAPAPERPIDGGMATEALLAHVVVSKFCDFLPLYRQSEMLKRQGITIDRSTLSDCQTPSTLLGGFCAEIGIAVPSPAAARARSAASPCRLLVDPMQRAAAARALLAVRCRSPPLRVANAAGSAPRLRRGRTSRRRCRASSDCAAASSAASRWAISCSISSMADFSWSGDDCSETTPETMGQKLLDQSTAAFSVSTRQLAHLRVPRCMVAVTTSRMMLCNAAEYFLAGRSRSICTAA